MISNLENAMAKQTEQATVQATGMESINNGMKPQGIATPDSNCSSINEKETSIDTGQHDNADDIINDGSTDNGSAKEAL